MKKSVIKVDFQYDPDNWELSDWPDDLKSAVKIEETEDEISFTVTLGQFKRAAIKKIIKEAMQAFWETDVSLWFGPKGLEFCSDDSETKFTIAYENLHLDDADAFKAMKEWLDREAKQRHEEDDAA